MSNNDEKIGMTPKELEFVFSQAARFGAWLCFLHDRKDIAQEVFTRHNGSRVTSEEQMEDMNSMKKKEAMVELASIYFSESDKYGGNSLVNHLSSLFFEEKVWDHIEVFNGICAEAKKKGLIK